MSSFALVWSYFFNARFELWETKQAKKRRTILRRLVHATCFEGGLVLMLVPVMAWWLDTTLAAAFVADLGVLAFFFVYSLVFTWVFDHVFGLPTSATQECEA